MKATGVTRKGGAFCLKAAISDEQLAIRKSKNGHFNAPPHIICFKVLS
jgi:hypothetical protein